MTQIEYMQVFSAVISGLCSEPSLVTASSIPARAIVETAIRIADEAKKQLEMKKY